MSRRIKQPALNSAIPTLHEMREYLPNGIYNITEDEWCIAQSSRALAHCVTTWKTQRVRLLHGYIKAAHDCGNALASLNPAYAQLLGFVDSLANAKSLNLRPHHDSEILRPDVDLSTKRNDVDVVTLKRRASHTTIRAGQEAADHFKYLRDFGPPVGFQLPAKITNTTLYLHPFRFRALQANGALRGRAVQEGILPTDLYADGFFYTGFRTLVTPDGADVGDMAVMLAARDASRPTPSVKTRWSARISLFTNASSVIAAERMNEAGGHDYGADVADQKAIKLAEFLADRAGADSIKKDAVYV